MVIVIFIVVRVLDNEYTAEVKVPIKLRQMGKPVNLKNHSFVRMRILNIP